MPSANCRTAHDLLEPGKYKVATSSWDLVSLALGLMFGTAGLPHILMRFYTVPDAREARKSVFVATGFIGYFYILTFTIGYGAAALISAATLAPVAKGGKSSNMAAPILAEVLGGGAFLGFLSAVAFATILAVVAGLTLAGASALSHDLYAGVIKRGESNPKDEVNVAKAATIGLGVLAVLLGFCSKTSTSRLWSAWLSPSPPAPIFRRFCFRLYGRNLPPKAPLSAWRRALLWRLF